MIPEVRTERLLLRAWQPSDRASFAEMNADPAVMEHFLRPLDRVASDALVDFIEREWEEYGLGLWAVEVPGVAGFIGFVGLSVPRFEAHFTPAVEVGWRLDKAHWGQGYATEGGREALRFGFEQRGLDEIISMTTLPNRRSQRVMQRLGMHHDPVDDFDHPRIAEGHPLRRHLLYRMTAADFESSGEGGI